MSTITKDPMNYKSYLQNNQEIIIKLRIIKHRIVDKLAIKDICFKYSMHRNTVRNIMKLYLNSASNSLRDKIQNEKHISSWELEKLCHFLLPQSRRPHSHPKQASESEEKMIIEKFNLLKLGTKRLRMTLERKWILWDLTLAKIRGVYKRQWFKVKKVRTKNWETRALYDYKTLWAFEDWHYDTKVLADAKSLPPHIYDNLKHNKHLPLHEWNIMFVWCRIRFTAYSRGKTSTFWLQFLVLVLSHLRSCWVTGEIKMHTDWWAEFFSNSMPKQAEWNKVLRELDSSIDCYNPNWDIRKNVIERSHKSDDEELLIPHWDDFKTLTSFMKHWQEYNDYRNKKRPHSGHAMNWRTPMEKLKDDWFHQAEKILDFKVLYLDSHFYSLQRHLDYFFFQRDLNSTPLEKLKTNRKCSLDLITQYLHLKSYAQNVLTYYQNQVL